VVVVAVVIAIPVAVIPVSMATAMSVFVPPATVIVAFDDAIRGPVARLVAISAVFMNVPGTDPASMPFAVMVPPARHPDPLIALPIPESGDPDRIAIRARKPPFISDVRRVGVPDVDFEMRHRGNRNLGRGRKREGRAEKSDREKPF